MEKTVGDFTHKQLSIICFNKNGKNGSLFFKKSQMDDGTILRHKISHKNFRN